MSSPAADLGCAIAVVAARQSAFELGDLFRAHVRGVHEGSFERPVWQGLCSPPGGPDPFSGLWGK